MSTRDSLQTPAYASAAASSSSLITPNLAALSDPPVRFADAAALDYLVIEMVHTLRDSSQTALARIQKLEAEMREAGLEPSPVPPEKGKGSSVKDKDKLKASGRESPGGTRIRVVSSTGTILGVEAEVDEEEQNLMLRLEAIGMHIGANIAERLCRERPRFNDTLDAVKFVCKDIWSTCWDKQVDNLRTNHRGVYVLQDNQFKPLSRISSYEGQADALRRARTYVAMPAGVIRGALSRMGYPASVNPEISHLPQCTFQVKLPRG